MTFPTVRPARRVHVPPPPSGQLPDPGGRIPAERSHRLQQQTADLYTRWRGSFPDGIGPDELKDAAGQFAFTDQALALPDALQAVKDDSVAANQKVDDLMKNTRVSQDGRAATDAFWYRKERSLDSIKDPSKLVAAAQDLVANADDDEIACLSEQLPDYLKSRQAPAGCFRQRWRPAFPAWLTDRRIRSSKRGSTRSWRKIPTRSATR